MRRSYLSNKISIPNYWHDYVNANIDILQNPKQPCPFHKEEHGKSFSYLHEKGYFSCFGACHVMGGDVVRMHMLNYKIDDYDKAEESLARLYGIKEEKEVIFSQPEIRIDEKDVKFRVAYAQACRVAKTPDDWLELDLIMSQYPPDVGKLEMFVNSRRVVGKGGVS